MALKTTDKGIFTKKMDTCLKAVKLCIEENAFETPTIALTNMINTFFDSPFMIINKNDNNLVIWSDNIEPQTFQLKQSFIDLLYPKEKDERIQIPGQLNISHFLDKELNKEATNKDDRSEIEKNYDDDYYFEENDR